MAVLTAGRSIAILSLIAKVADALNEADYSFQ